MSAYAPANSRGGRYRHAGRRRFRAGMIAQDLLALGLSPATLAGLRQHMIAPFSRVAEALGWLYVHQRGSLLHEAVLAKLTARLPEVAHATTYLRANEGHIGVVWDDLGQKSSGTPTTGRS